MDPNAAITRLAELHNLLSDVSPNCELPGGMMDEYEDLADNLAAWINMCGFYPSVRDVFEQYVLRTVVEPRR